MCLFSTEARAGAQSVPPPPLGAPRRPEHPLLSVGCVVVDEAAGAAPLCLLPLPSGVCAPPRAVSQIRRYSTNSRWGENMSRRCSARAQHRFRPYARREFQVRQRRGQAADPEQSRLAPGPRVAAAERGGDRSSVRRSCASRTNASPPSSRAARRRRCGEQKCAAHLRAVRGAA